MTHVYFTEYARQARDLAGHGIPVGEDPPLAQHRVAIGAASVQSDVLNAKTTFVEISVRGACNIAGADTSPTAVATSPHYEVGTVMFRGVQPGRSLRYAVIQPQA